MARIPLETPVTRPLGLTSSIGMNIAWPSYWFSQAFFKDGFSDWADSNSFNSTGANSDIQSQLDIIKEHGIKYVRIWLNMRYYFNSDAETAGWTAFRLNMLTSLATYYDWCSSRGIKIMLVLDGGSEFPYAWVNDGRWPSYIAAAVAVINTIKDKSAAWAIDYANENYAANLTPYGYDKSYLTLRFVDLYTAIKAVAPTLYCSVGSAGEPDITNYGISAAVDFYQLHFYSSAYNSFNAPNTYTDKPMIIGECGILGGNNVYNDALVHRIIGNYLSLGYPMVMLWNFYQLLSKNSPTVYGIHKTLSRFKNYKET